MSVTPVIGARITGLAIVTGPTCRGARVREVTGWNLPEKRAAYKRKPVLRQGGLAGGHGLG
ncbi:hypothetical protein D9M73_113680 [compost metagenome]